MKYQQILSFLPPCQILCHFVSYSYSTKLAYGEKTFVFGQDVLNAHGFKCTQMCIVIFFLDHDYSFGALIRKASKTYNDKELCKEAKTVIVVDKWLNCLNLENPIIWKSGNCTFRPGMLANLEEKLECSSVGTSIEPKVCWSRDSLYI